MNGGIFQWAMFGYHRAEEKLCIDMLFQAIQKKWDV